MAEDFVATMGLDDSAFRAGIGRAASAARSGLGAIEKNALRSAAAVASVGALAGASAATFDAAGRSATRFGASVARSTTRIGRDLTDTARAGRRVLNITGGIGRAAGQATIGLQRLGATAGALGGAALGFGSIRGVGRALANAASAATRFGRASIPVLTTAARIAPQVALRVGGIALAGRAVADAFRGVGEGIRFGFGPARSQLPAIRRELDVITALLGEASASSILFGIPQAIGQGVGTVLGGIGAAATFAARGGTSLIAGGIGLTERALFGEATLAEDRAAIRRLNETTARRAAALQRLRQSQAFERELRGAAPFTNPGITPSQADRARLDDFIRQVRERGFISTPEAGSVIQDQERFFAEREARRRADLQRTLAQLESRSRAAGAVAGDVPAFAGLSRTERERAAAIERAEQSFRDALIDATESLRARGATEIEVSEATAFLSRIRKSQIDEINRAFDEQIEAQRDLIDAIEAQELAAIEAAEQQRRAEEERQQKLRERFALDDRLLRADVFELQGREDEARQIRRRVQFERELALIRESQRTEREKIEAEELLRIRFALGESDRGRFRARTIEGGLIAQPASLLRQAIGAQPGQRQTAESQLQTQREGTAAAKRIAGQVDRIVDRLDQPRRLVF